jgi:lysophospholipase L1-like esterase
MNFFRFLAVRIGRWFVFLVIALASKNTLAASLDRVFYLGDSYLDDGNYKALTKGVGPNYYSNSAPWSTVADTALGLTSAGRWTPEGSHSPLGNNYAVSGSGINYSSTPTNTSFHSQIAKLLEDYPRGLPPNSLVVLAIGTNDVRGVIGFGGIWSNSATEWRLGDNGFTVPAVNASVTVSVTSTTGLTPGPMNLVSFPNSSVPTMLVLDRVDPTGTQITLTNKVGTAGTKIPPKSAFEVCGKWFLDQELQILNTDIRSLIADRANLIFVLLPPTDILPEFNRKPNQALAHETWKYFYDNMRALIPKDSKQVLTFDLKPVFQDVFSDPTHYGFKLSYPCWIGTGSADPNEYMFWDTAHPTGSMHRYIAQRFVEFLRAKGLAPQP